MPSLFLQGRYHQVVQVEQCHLSIAMTKANGEIDMIIKSIQFHDSYSVFHNIRTPSLRSSNNLAYFLGKPNVISFRRIGHALPPQLWRLMQLSYNLSRSHIPQSTLKVSMFLLKNVMSCLSDITELGAVKALLRPMVVRHTSFDCGATTKYRWQSSYAKQPHTLCCGSLYEGIDVSRQRHGFSSSTAVIESSLGVERRFSRASAANF